MKTFAVLLSLFAASTLVSQSAMDLFAGLMTIWMIGLIVSRPAWRQEFLTSGPRGLAGLLGLWIAAVFLSLLIGYEPEKTGAILLKSFKWILVMYTVYWGLLQTKLTEKILTPSSCFLAFCSAYAIFVYILGRDPINPDYNLAPWAGGHRTGGFLSNAMTFAHVYGVVFCVFAGVFLHYFENRGKTLAYISVALGLTGVALVLSFTRGVWISVFIAGLVMAFLYRPKLSALFGASVAAILALLVQVWPALSERLSQFSLAQDERAWIWAAHWRIFLDHPWTGAGYTLNVELSPQYYLVLGAPESTIVSHAHNQYLQWLAGTGVVGLFAYMLVVLFFLGLSFRTYKKTPSNDLFKKGLALGIFGAQICFLLGGLTEANFEHSKMKYMMSLVWGISLYLYSSVNSVRIAQR